ncbi:MAG: MFS transporter [Microbacterium sp.]
MTTTIHSSLTELRIPRGSALAVLASSMFLIVLDGAMVNLAAQTIRDGLRLTSAELTIVANSYLIAVAGLVLLGGRLADVLGARRMFLIGMSAYVAASALCALAISGPMLIVGRIGQGVGAAMTIPAALALVLVIYTTAADRTRALGVWGAVTAAGSLIGVFAGGMLTEALGWQSVFWAPVPLGIIAMAMVWRTIPPIPGRSGRFDVAGALTITIAITALALGSVNAAEVGWTSPITLTALAAGLAALLMFVTVERKSPHPLVPSSVFRRVPVLTASVVMMLLGGTLTSAFFFLPLYQQGDLGMGALETGLAQVPIAVMLIVGSVLAPVMSKVMGLERALPVSLTALLAGFVWIALNPATSFTWQHIGAFVLLGLGLGLGLVTGMTMAVRDSTEGESGLLSGVVNAAQSLGGAVGLAVLAGIALTTGEAGEMNFTAAFLGAAMLITAAIAISGFSALTTRHASTKTH